MDGKHVAIRAPFRSGSQYYNYKGVNNIVLIAACDAFYKFTSVDVGSHGSICDGGIFGESSFGKAVLSDNLQVPGGCLPGRDELVPLWFVTNEAFPLKVNIMRLYPGHNLDEGRRIFNCRLSRTRRTIKILLEFWWHGGKFSKGRLQESQKLQRKL